MSKTPESREVKQGSEIPELIQFLNLKPDEQLRILRLTKPGLTLPTVEVRKLETPYGTDDVGLSGCMEITENILSQSVNYLMRINLSGKSEIEKRKLSFIREKIMEIQFLLE